MLGYNENLKEMSCGQDKTITVESQGIVWDLISAVEKIASEHPPPSPKNKWDFFRGGGGCSQAIEETTS